MSTPNTSNTANIAPKPWLLLFFAISAIWGSSFLFMRVAGLEFGVFPSACLRMAIGALVMLPLLAWRGLLGELAANWKSILLISLVNAAIPFASYAFAVLHITTGLAAILNGTAPMFSALVTWLWLGQRLSKLRMVGIAIGFVGIALLVGEQAGLKGNTLWLSVLSIFACLLATFCYGLSGNVIKERLSHLHPWVIAGGTMIGAALWLAVPSLLTLPAAIPSAKAWGAIAIVGIFCSAVAFMLYFTLLQRVDAAKTQSVTYLIPVFAIIYGVLFLGESLTIWMIFCAAVIAVGTALATGLLTFKPKANAA